MNMYKTTICFTEIRLSYYEGRVNHRTFNAKKKDGSDLRYFHVRFVVDNVVIEQVPEYFISPPSVSFYQGLTVLFHPSSIDGI